MNLTVTRQVRTGQDKISQDKIISRTVSAHLHLTCPLLCSPLRTVWQEHAIGQNPGFLLVQPSARPGSDGRASATRKAAVVPRPIARGEANQAGAIIFLPTFVWVQTNILWLHERFLGALLRKISKTCLIKFERLWKKWSKSAETHVNKFNPAQNSVPANKISFEILLLLLCVGVGTSRPH